MSDKPDLKLVSDDTASDGRKARSQRSREQIVDALFTLIEAGDMNPSVASVAEEASLASMMRAGMVALPLCLKACKRRSPAINSKVFPFARTTIGWRSPSD